ncbi:MAG TPA: DNA-processing protein DprA [Gammaproteobacteria bacterium]|nr:DNA-processing protein DprA [Gammaproteobacteria bacterium]
MDWLTLIRAPRLGNAGALRLLQHCGGAAGCFTSDIPTSLDLHPETRAFLRAPDRSAAEQDLDWMQKTGARLLAVTEPAYPQLLKQIPDPPFALFVRGDASLLAEPQLAMVGSRNPSVEGRRNAEEFAEYLAKCGLVITSGMALGIDAASHKGALKGGKTVAVWGTGLDKPYPPRNRELAKQILEQGVIVSEFPPGTPPLPMHFPRRNRIISGLSVGTLVVEAAKQSGSLITARLASEQGREVFAIPGSIHNPMARGCHRLLRDGAKLVESGADVLEELAPLLGIEALQAAPPPVPGAEAAAPEDPEYKLLLNSLDFAPTSVDALVERTGLTPDVVSSMLLMLELQGHVETAPGGRYSRVNKRS